MLAFIVCLEIARLEWFSCISIEHFRSRQQKEREKRSRTRKRRGREKEKRERRKEGEEEEKEEESERLACIFIFKVHFSVLLKVAKVIPCVLSFFMIPYCFSCML